MMEALKFTFSSLMTEDEATKKAIGQAQLAISKKLDCLWIEGESGTGKTLLAHTICAQQEDLASLLGTRHITLSSPDFVTLNLLDALTSDEPIILYVSISEDASKEELEKFHNLMVNKLHQHDLTPALLVFMTTNNAHYSPEVRKYIRLLQSIFLETSQAHIRLPALREKKNDIALLARYFLRQFSRKHKLTDGAAETLKLYDWKNNMKCLQLMCFKLAQNDETEIIYARHVTKAYQEIYSADNEDSSDTDGIISREQITINLLDNEGNLRNFQDLEEEIYARACQFKRGCKSSAARDLGIGRTTLYRKLKHI